MGMAGQQTIIAMSQAEHLPILSQGKAILHQEILIEGHPILRLLTQHHLRLVTLHLLHLQQGHRILRHLIAGLLLLPHPAADLRLLQVEMFVRVNNNIRVI
jgi:hypothetical protein